MLYGGEDSIRPQSFANLNAPRRECNDLLQRPTPSQAPIPAAWGKMTP